MNTNMLVTRCCTPSLCGMAESFLFPSLPVRAITNGGQVVDSGFGSLASSRGASRQISAVHSRQVSPTRQSRQVSPTRQSRQTSRRESPTRLADTAVYSKRSSRCTSPDSEQRSRRDVYNIQPFTAVLPGGRVCQLDDVAASRICAQAHGNEIDAAKEFLKVIDWESVSAFDKASEESDLLGLQYSKHFEKPCTLPTEIDTAEWETLNFASNLYTLIDTAWNSLTDEEELRRLEANEAAKPMQVHRRSSKPRKEDYVYNIRYKTQPCMHFQRMRQCPAGPNCHFSHGPEELRKAQDHPKYKTQPCTNYVNGKCPYGAKCFFSHDLQIAQADTL